MALAGAPRLILFDEPAAGLSPDERRELVALLRALPPHMGFVLIEHDLDIALRVVDRVSVLHNGRLLEGRHARRDRERRRSAGDLHGDAALMLGVLPPARASASARQRAGARDREPRRALRPRARAAGGVADARLPASSRSSAATAWARRRCATRSPVSVPATGSIRLLGEEIRGLPPHAITERGVGYVPQGRRVWPSLSVDEHLRLASRHRDGPWTPERVYRDVPAARRAQAQRRRGALRRRAADARDRARAAVQSARCW